jgi:hypothetical protein
MTSARDLADRLAALLRTERGAMADFILALADFDERRGWFALGYPSLFAFLRSELRLSAGAAQYRKTAAELVREYPEVEAALRDGKLCLSSMCEVAKVVSRENVAEILPRFFGLSARDAGVVSAQIRPVEDPPTRAVVTGFRETAPIAAASEASRPAAGGDLLLRTSEVIDRGQVPLAAPAPFAATERSSTVDPLDANRGRLHLTVTREFLGKLEAATDLLSHSHPGATPDQILEVALDALIEAKRAKKYGIVKKPRKTSPPSSRGDVFPASVRRAIYERAQGRCECLLPNGERCGETRWLELDHIRPRALGGESTLPNGRVACRLCRERHNRHYADWSLIPSRSVEPLSCSEFRAADAA